MNNNNRQPRLDPQQTIDEITNYIMDEFVRGKITTSNIDTDEDDEMYTKIWNNINAIIYDDGR
jgi:hypothetical protein